MDDITTLSDLLATAPSRRRRIWELQKSFQCSICGTCLTLAELHKIARKMKLQLPPGARDYQIHGIFVHQASESGPVAKHMHKLLDRKYRIAIERSRKCTDDAALLDVWESALRQGDVPGPYWALMTHPRASESLTGRIFGDVHMLSHLVGAANRADLVRLHALEHGVQSSAAELSRLRQQLRAREERIDDLERCRQADAAEIRCLKARDRELRACESRQSAEQRAADLDRMGAALARAEHDRDDACRESARLASELADVRLALTGKDEAIEALRAETKAMEAALQSSVGVSDVEEGGRAIDLEGRRIAYVGGFTHLVGQFRYLVERAGGSFVHHDGGIEEHGSRLEGILSHADAVMCPIDCVSHTACLKAKQFCKRTRRRFVPLRSAGLSSFVSALERLTAAPGPSQPSGSI